MRDEIDLNQSAKVLSLSDMANMSNLVRFGKDLVAEVVDVEFTQNITQNTFSVDRRIDGNLRNFLRGNATEGALFCQLIGMPMDPLDDIGRQTQRFNYVLSTPLSGAVTIQGEVSSLVDDVGVHGVLRFIYESVCIDFGTLGLPCNLQAPLQLP